jgi:phosphonate transport system permease protein
MAIAFLGTLAAGFVALPLGLLAARNVLPVWIFRFSIRRGLGSVGSVDTFIRTLIWIKCCRARSLRRRIGNMMSDVEAFGKLCPEAIETADPKPVEGITAPGGGRLREQARFGLIPPALPVIINRVLYYFESKHALGDHHWHRGCRRHRLALVGADSHPGMAASPFPHSANSREVALIDWASSRIRFALIGRKG